MRVDENWILLTPAEFDAFLAESAAEENKPGKWIAAGTIVNGEVKWS